MFSSLGVGGGLHALCVQEAQLARYICAAHPPCTRLGTHRLNSSCEGEGGHASEPATFTTTVASTPLAATVAAAAVATTLTTTAIATAALPTAIAPNALPSRVP